MGAVSKETWACDVDPNIENKDFILKRTKEDLGLTASMIISTTSLMNTVKLVHAPIHSIPNYFPKFDKIFCISTLEHMPGPDIVASLLLFSKHLSEDGLVVLTVDHPDIDPNALLEAAAAAGPVPVGDVDMLFLPRRDDIEDSTLTNGHLTIFRCLLTHATNTTSWTVSPRFHSSPSTHEVNQHNENILTGTTKGGSKDNRKKNKRRKRRASML